MKIVKRLLLSLVFMMILGTTSYTAPFGSKLHVIKNTTSGVAESTTSAAPKFSPAENGWSAQTLTDAGVDFFIYTVVPGATLPVHDSPEEWLGYVISGDGVLGLAGNDKKVTSTVKFSKGDFIVFKPNTMHNWEAGSDLLLLVLKTTKTK